MKGGTPGRRAGIRATTREGDPASSRGRPVVLVIEDDSGGGETAGLALDDGFEVRRAADVSTALQLVRREVVDAVLLDILTSRVDGLEMLARLKDARPSLPVIVVTGFDRAAVGTEAIRRGAEDCVTKPCTAGTLGAAIEGALHRRTAPISILLVGTDVTLLATLKAVLRRGDLTEIASGATAVFEHCAHFRPRLGMIDDSMGWGQVLSVANAMRRSAPDTVLAVGCSADRHADALSDVVASVRPDAVIPKPYDFNQFRTWVDVAVDGRPGGGSRRLSPPVVRALEYVARQYQALTVDAAARAAAVSPGYLAHLFSAETGSTFWRHVTSVRLELVRDLLSQTDYKLGHIAARAGFSDGPHLWRVFHQRYGETPGHYRRRVADRREPATGRRHAG
ncbi:MAG TPA: response regulator [Methylomirabilota bacterium]